MGLRKHDRFPILHVFAILSLLIGASFGLSAGNPYRLAGVVPPDQETYPPIITITSPVNNTAYNTSRVPLTFNVTAPQSRTASYVTVDRVTYEIDCEKSQSVFSMAYNSSLRSISGSQTCLKDNTQ